MPPTARNYGDRQEFWKPVPQRQVEPLRPEVAAPICESCGTDFVVGSRFCHVCGTFRQADRADAEWYDLGSLRAALGHTYASLIALFLGLVCIIAAAATGFLFKATTLLDWQAVQMWRIEWLLASAAAFAAGLLLRKR